jgi:hypothetical protein
MHVPSSLSRIIMSGLLLGIVLPVRTFWFHNMVKLPSWLLSTDFGTWLYHYYYYYYYYNNNISERRHYSSTASCLIGQYSIWMSGF